MKGRAKQNLAKRLSGLSVEGRQARVVVHTGLRGSWSSSSDRCDWPWATPTWFLLPVSSFSGCCIWLKPGGLNACFGADSSSSPGIVAAFPVVVHAHKCSRYAAPLCCGCSSTSLIKKKENDVLYVIQKRKQRMVPCSRVIFFCNATKSIMA